MKKFLAFLIMIAVLNAGLFAAVTYLDNTIGSILIYGYIDQYCILYTSPIEAESETDIAGVPFNIANDDITYNSSDLRLGRQIGTWSFATNISSVSLSFDASPLVHELEPSYSLGYYMTFRYVYSGVDGTGNITTTNGYITVHSGEHSNNIISNVSAETESPIISMNNDIRFMLDRAYDIGTYPDGFYNATVTITLEGR